MLADFLPPSPSCAVCSRAPDADPMGTSILCAHSVLRSSQFLPRADLAYSDQLAYKQAGQSRRPGSLGLWVLHVGRARPCKTLYDDSQRNHVRRIVFVRCQTDVRSILQPGEIFVRLFDISGFTVVNAKRVAIHPQVPLFPALFLLNELPCLSICINTHARNAVTMSGNLCSDGRPAQGSCSRPFYLPALTCAVMIEGFI